MSRKLVGYIYQLWEDTPGDPFREGDWTQHQRRFIWQFDNIEAAQKLKDIIDQNDPNFPVVIIEAKPIYHAD